MSYERDILNTLATSASVATSLAAKQGSFNVADEGLTLTAVSGAVSHMNFVGAGISASLTGGILTVTAVAGAGSGEGSVSISTMISTALVPYLTSASAALSTYVTSGSLSTALAPYVTSNSLSAALAAFQPVDGDLTAIAALTLTYGITRKTAENTWSIIAETASAGDVLRGNGTFGNVGTAAIAGNAVINTKLEDMATQTIKGRITAATGDPEDLTAAQVRTILGISITPISVTLGSGLGVSDFEVTITDAAVISTSLVEVWQASTISTDENEPEFTSLVSAIARAATGSFDLSLTFNELHSGTLKLQYRIN